MKRSDLKPGMFIQRGNILYRVATLYARTFTVSQEIPIPARIRVLRFHFDGIDEFEPCGERMLRRYRDAHSDNSLHEV
jgi:hypothetical protein